jgi:signal transduction histidine kinase
MNKNRTIMIVDDSLILGKSLERFLANNGYAAVAVGSGEECLRRIEDGELPDLILMDIYLGSNRMDGPETTARLHELHDIPVILHSAYNDRETLHSTRDMTKYGYVYKTPGNEEFVLATIEMAFKLIDRERMYRDLSDHIHRVKEEQNAFLAREIHDDLGQSIAALKMNLTMLERSHDQEQMSSIIYDMRSILDGTVNKIRSLIHELRPPVLDTSGIVEALRWHATDFERTFGIPVLFTNEPREVYLGSEKSLAVFRIVQEALTNSVRHGQPTRIEITVHNENDCFTVRVADNGQGFVLNDSPAAGTFGLLGMQERAQRFGGKVQIATTPGEGTHVTATIPVGDQE